MRLLLLACIALTACSPQPAVTPGTVPKLDDAFDFGSLEIVTDAGETLRFEKLDPEPAVICHPFTKLIPHSFSALTGNDMNTGVVERRLSVEHFCH